MKKDTKEIAGHMQALKQDPKGVLGRMYSGRIGQKNFAILGAIMIGIEYALTYLIFVPITVTLPGVGTLLSFLVSMVFTFVFLCHLFVRRLNDLGHPGWYAIAFFLIMLLPGLAQAASALTLLAYIALVLFPGTAEKNEYGEVPNLNRSIVKEYFNKD